MTWEADLAEQRFTKLAGSHFDTWGFSKEEWLSPGFWATRIHPEDFPAVADVCGTAITDQIDGHFECRMSTAAGSMMWFEGSVGPISENGRTIGLRGSLADITERKLRESSEANPQHMEAVGRLAGGVAHDFNNLLTVIKTYSDLIAFNLDSSDPNTRYIQAIRTAVGRAVALTDQLLLFSTQSVGAKSTVDLNNVLRVMQPLLESMVDEDTTLSLELDPKLSMVRGDDGSLEQVVMNLAQNSLNAVRQLAKIEGASTGGKIRFRTRNTVIEATSTEVQNQDLKPGEHVELLCIDDGAGMDPDVAVRAFEPFFTTQDVGEGQGLGLTVVYGIAQQLDGSVSIQSQQGHGATIRILLPLAHLDTVPEPTSSAGDFTGGTETVLLVEDDEDTRRAEELILTRLGYRVLVAADPLAALALVDDHADPIDLILTDVEMPGMFGQELVNQLRPKLPGLRVLFTSGYSAQALQSQLSGERFIAKPFTLSTLASSVRSALDDPPTDVPI